MRPACSPPIRVVAWEVTRRCNLRCAHCRAAAEDHPYAGEFSPEEARELVEQIARVRPQVLILSGGEPLMRPDLEEIVEAAAARGLQVALATNGCLVDRERARALRAAGLRRASISLDGATPAVHDGFRGVPGAFERSLAGLEALRAAGVEVQLNATATARTVGEIPQLFRLAERLGVDAFHLFVLVPMGRGWALEGITPQQYEELLRWFLKASQSTSMETKATCAPCYYRLLAEEGMGERGRGCLAGWGFCFISHRGVVQPCGYLELPCGDVRRQPLERIWQDSEVFRSLRDLASYRGRCGSCAYLEVCGGCRARAYYEGGDLLGEDPLCPF